jgi:hypothetical protein
MVGNRPTILDFPEIEDEKYELDDANEYVRNHLCSNQKRGFEKLGPLDKATRGPH